MAYVVLVMLVIILSGSGAIGGAEFLIGLGIAFVLILIGIYRLP